jgi:DNA-binding transcriptional regulator LsrR (DeoR family)
MFSYNTVDFLVNGRWIVTVSPQKKAKPIKARRKRKRLTDEERVRLTLDRFAPLRDGRRMEELSVLGKNKRDPAVVSRAIADAFRRRLVEIRAVPSNEYPRDKSLEDALGSRFKLPGAIVIRFDDLPRRAPGKVAFPKLEEQQHAQELRKWNDRLHSALGFALARVIAGGFVFGRGSRVGIGSGRGVFFVIDWLSQLTKLHSKNVEAFSLTGATYPQTWAAEGTNLRLDADTNVNLFVGHCFASPVKPYFVHSPIIASPEERNAVYARAPWLGEDQSGRVTLTHAIVGVGAFTWGHRLYEEGKARSAQVARTRDESEMDAPALSESHRFQGGELEIQAVGERVFDPIGPELVKLANLCDQCNSLELSPVADICHNLLSVEPPPDAKGSQHLAELVRDCIAMINEKRPFITISENRLTEIDNIMLVAGGPKKAGSIRLLLQRGYPITLLCTDHITAQQLLK